MPPEQEAASETPIRDAACLILVDRSEAEPRLLMGRRLATQVFLPNKWVFPGGRVEDDDRALAVQLAADVAAAANDTNRLAFALAAIRELFEEAGVVLGVGHNASKPQVSSGIYCRDPSHSIVPRPKRSRTRATSRLRNHGSRQ
jgi:8-oxo-dGTP pyrophosphatase MutT (NUDIX family)